MAELKPSDAAAQGQVLAPARAPRRLALLGGESSGKTTLAQALAETLGTVWVPEYGRQRWEELRKTLDRDELLGVVRRQVEMEDEAAERARDWLVCDTTPLTTLQYCLHDHGDAPEALWALARRRYDMTLVCLPDFDFVQDGCRRDDGFRARQHDWTLARLAELGVAWVGVSGSLDQRVRQALAELERVAGLASQPNPAGCPAGLRVGPQQAGGQGFDQMTKETLRGNP